MTNQYINSWYSFPVEPRPLLSSLTVHELRKRAQEHRDMAATARTTVAHEGLLKLAAHFDAMADAKEKTAARA
jgi:hypothetical protein